MVSKGQVVGMAGTASVTRLYIQSHVLGSYDLTNSITLSH